MTARSFTEAFAQARADEGPEARTLYEFGWRTEPTRQWKTLPAASGTEVGWFDGRNWVAVFGDGMWSKEFVTGWRELNIADLLDSRERAIRWAVTLEGQLAEVAAIVERMNLSSSKMLLVAALTGSTE